MNRIEEIRRFWSDYKPENNRKEAAVLIPLIADEEGNCSILFELRARDLKIQPGEICFPGGHRDDGESLEECVIRETCEELLVRPEQIELIGSMGASYTRSNSMPIWPYIGILHDYGQTWSEDEVDHTFTIPVEWFISHAPEEYTVRTVMDAGDDFPYDRVPDGRNYNWNASVRKVYFYDYYEDGVVLWGVTAAIIRSFIEKLDQ